MAKVACALDLLGQINDFIEQLKQTELIAAQIFIVTFENDFGSIPFPQFITNRGREFDAKVRWLRSEEGKQALAEAVENRLTDIRASGQDPNVELSRVGVRNALNIRREQNKKARDDEYRRKLQSSRCPSGRHGVGEGPCQFVGGGKWGVDTSSIA